MLAFTFTQMKGQHCISLFEGANFKWDQAESELNVMAVDDSMHVWAGIKSTFGTYGLGKYNGTSWFKFNKSNSNIPDNNVRAIAFDQKDSVWVGTASGLAKFDGHSKTGWKIFNTASGLGSNDITALFVDSKNRKWIGLANGGVYLFNETAFQLSVNTGSTVTQIAEDANGTIYVASLTSSGIRQFNGTSWTILTAFSGIRSLLASSNKDLWISTNEKVYHYTGSSWAEFIIPDTITAWSLARAADGSVWASSDSGLLQLKSGKCFRYNSSNSYIPSNLTYAIATGKDGKIWFSHYTVDAGSGFTLAAMGNLNPSSTLGLEISAPSGPAFCKGKSTSLDAGTGYSSYYWNTAETSRSILASSPGSYTVSVSNGAGCFDFDTIDVAEQIPDSTQELCMVLVSKTNKNVVIWERNPDRRGTAFFKIYKETKDAGEYLVADTVYWNEMTMYTDLKSQPEIRSNRYKISVVDSCGNESELSSPHKTMHIIASLGLQNRVNLSITDPYEGFQYSSFIIMRGTNKDNLVDIDTIPSNLTTYTDTYWVGKTPPPTLVYQVVVEKNFDCSPTSIDKAGSGPYKRSTSNMEQKSMATELGQIVLSDTTFISNSPAGTLIGELSTFDLDTTKIFTYELVQGDGDTDNAKFEIRGDSLLSLQQLSYASQQVYSVRVRSTDQGSLNYTEKIIQLAAIPVGVTRVHELPLLIYPNPASESLTILFGSRNRENTWLSVLDLGGRQLSSSLIPPGNLVYTIPLNHLTPGTYLLKISTGKQSVHKLFVKE